MTEPRVHVAERITDFPEARWNALTGGNFPFLRHEFLAAAEAHGCVSPDTGWTPRHIGLLDASGELLAAMPLYEKTHSWGEFVFDWSWAQAYQQAGLNYYPKLVSTAPFTPATSPKLLSTCREHRTALADAAVEFARDGGHSSLHVLFPMPDELDDLRETGLKIRKDCQFHWHNHRYENFDAFLATFSSAKRKKARRERRRVREQGIRFRWLNGADLDAALWLDIYELISMTFLRRGSMPYFSYDFFVELSARLPDNILVVLAEKNRSPVAAAVFYDTPHALYGRYWGTESRHNALHFETCYYQGIDYCIANRRTVFEPGTQGEHKVSRGFLPVETWSAHWLERPEFFAAVGQYLKSETRHVERYIQSVNAHTPYRREESATSPGRDQ